MTQIMSITDDWLHDLHVCIYEFEKEYEVKPHIYTNPELHDCMACTNNFIRIKSDYNIGRFEGCSIEFDSSIAKDTIILKA